MNNIIAIVGRPNVGKSTLFNRLVEKRQAIMDNMPGVTRDRHYGYAEWNGKYFTVIDTGGYVTGSEGGFDLEIRKQIEIALEESSAVLFVVDCKDGLTGFDKDFANVVRTSNKPVFLVANKADTPDKAPHAAEFYQLGIGDPYVISAENGSGTGDLLDAVVAGFPNEGTEDPYAGVPRVAILGRPNVGKSSLLNALLGNERTIVTDIAGTTRDAIDTHYNLYGKSFILTDTAGIRRKSKVHEDVEFYSVMRSLRALEECDVCIIVLDAEQGLESQDVNIISLADRQGKGIVVMVNKWDLVEKESRTADDYRKAILAKLAPIDYVPVVFASALSKQRIYQVMETATQIYENKQKHIATAKLNETLLPEVERHPPPALKGKFIQIKYVTQVKARFPTFAFFCNLPQYIQAPYQRYLANRIREHFDFQGVPIRLIFKRK